MPASLLRPPARQVILGAGYDDAADIWSLACMVFELVRGLGGCWRQGLRGKGGGCCAGQRCAAIAVGPHTTHATVPLCPPLPARSPATCCSTPRHAPASGARTRTTWRRWVGGWHRRHGCACWAAPPTPRRSVGCCRPPTSDHHSTTAAPLADDGDAAAHPARGGHLWKVLGRLLHARGPPAQVGCGGGAGCTVWHTGGGSAAGGVAPGAARCGRCPQ